MVMGESFIGGFAGGFLQKGHRIGYGLYFTTSRLIGIDLGSHGGGALAGTLAGFIHGELMPKLSPEEGVQTIRQLDGMKDFEIPQDRIRSIELKEPTIFSGRFTVIPVDGHPIEIKLRHRTAYDRLIQLTQVFSPELVRRT